jgi:RimJ/RimL family protein N-acetyltransferase
MSDRLETERLRLRPLTMDDVDNLFELDSDPEVMRYLSGGPATPREVIADEILPRFIRIGEQYSGFGYWAGLEKTTSAFLGWFSLAPTRDGDTSEAELGYRLLRSAWGRGYATEGSRALIDKAFAETDVQRIIATTYQDNLGSRRVMEKSGLTFVRAFRITLEDIRAEGTYQSSSDDLWDGDDVEYALTRVDWERLREAE